MSTRRQDLKEPTSSALRTAQLIYDHPDALKRVCPELISEYAEIIDRETGLPALERCRRALEHIASSDDELGSIFIGTFGNDQENPRKWVRVKAFALAALAETEKG